MNKGSDTNGKLILIVEDVVSNHILIERSLDKIGLQSIWANNGEEAVQFCREFESISLVLMDLRLPVLDGFEATRKITALRPALPIIAQTAYLMPYEKSTAIEAGCVDLITKPYKSDDIIRIIERYL